MFIDIAPSVCVNLLCSPWVADEVTRSEIFATSCKYSIARLGVTFFLGNSNFPFAQKINQLIIAFEGLRLFNLVHEMGHFFAAKTLTVKQPQLKLTERGGEVRYSLVELSSIGKRFGPLNSKRIIHAAGPFFEGVAGALCWSFGSSFEKQSVLGSYIKIAGIISLIKVGTDTFLQEDKSDSQVLEGMGVSRQTSLISLVMLPLILAYGYTHGTLSLFQDG